MTSSRPRLSWVAALAAAGPVCLASAAAGCLPRGAPPVGQQILADRSASLAALVPPNGDGLLRMLLMRPGAASNLANLSVVSLDADNQLSPEVPLISDIDPVSSVNCPGGVAPCGFDDRGRVQVFFPQTNGSAWLDPVTGAIEPIDIFNPRPSGQRYFSSQSPTTGTLYDVDGHGTPIQLATPAPSTPSNSYAFAGDDFYYLDPQHNLIDIPPSDVPEQVASGVTHFAFWNTADGLLLVLTRMAADGSGTQSLVGDPRSGTQTVVPFDVVRATISPDGRWVLDLQNGATGQFTFFGRDAGAQQSIDIGQPAIFTDWRPGTSQAWMMSSAADYRDPGTLWVLQPDAPPVSVPGIGVGHLSTDGGRTYSTFTPDGVYWFSVTPTSEDGTNTFAVGAAGDPTGPRYDLNPPATFLSRAWYLPDGQFLSTSYAKDSSRADANLLDPRTGRGRLLGERGVVAAVGQTRFMGMFHLAESRGDLIAGGFEAEGSTSLGSEFVVRSFAEPHGADLLAPGTRIVYQFQARTASPYDGMWVTKCP